MRPYTFQSMTKSTTQKFDFRFAPSGYAIIFADDVSGRISMQTDWGNFDFGWSRSGRGKDSLIEFVVSCDTGYLLNKFCRRTYFDEKATKAEMKKHVEESPVFGEEKDEALREIENADWDSCGEIYHSIGMQCPTLFEKVYLSDLYGVPAHMDYTPCEAGFFNEVWPLIREKLKESLEVPSDRTPNET